MVATLVERLAPAESLTTDDEVVNAEVVVALMDLGAVEAADAIRAAYDEQRVDPSIVGFNFVASELGLTTLPAQRTDVLVLHWSAAPAGMRATTSLLGCITCLGRKGLRMDMEPGPAHS